MINSLLHNIRFYIILFSLILSLIVYICINTFIPPEGSLRVIRVTQLFALIGLVYLYITLMISPVIRLFRGIPYRSQLLRSRRAMGVSAFYFATLHAGFAFWGQLGGFIGLSYLSNNYLLAISLSFTSWLIMLLMAVTAFDNMVKKLGPAAWKALHRFVYLAGILIVIHAFMLGSHFSDLSSSLPQVFFVALAVLLFLEALRIDVYLYNRFHVSRFGSYATVCIIILLVILSQLFFPLLFEKPTSFNIHSQHKDTIHETTETRNHTMVNMPGMDGDRSKRYTVFFDQAQSILPQQNVQLRFSVFDASNGDPIVTFRKNYEKFSHLIIINENFEYFSHVHPEQDKNMFFITHAFPEEGRYRVYLDFLPLEGIEQQFAFTVNVGRGTTEQISITDDVKTTKVFGSYEVTLATQWPLQAKKMSLGEQILSFTLLDAKTKSPVSDLQPYLGSYGHLVMINKKTFDYLHVHPSILITPGQTNKLVSEVTFMPIGLYRDISPGIYEIFAQFNPNGQLITTNFTVEVK